MADSPTKEQKGGEIYADMEVLRHTLGVDSNKSRKQWGRRNYFNADEGHHDMPSIKRLVEAGLMEQYRPGYWRATALGMDVVGLRPEEARRARE